MLTNQQQNNTENIDPMAASNVMKTNASVTKASTTAAIKAQEHTEALLMSNPSRFVLFPIKYQDVCAISSLF
jgi:hypothetical protein